MVVIFLIQKRINGISFQQTFYHLIKPSSPVLPYLISCPLLCGKSKNCNLVTVKQAEWQKINLGGYFQQDKKSDSHSDGLSGEKVKK